MINNRRVKVIVSTKIVNRITGVLDVLSDGQHFH
jgi:hypothetical protein